MHILYLLLSFFATNNAGVSTNDPLKIGIIYYSAVDKNLKAELLQNIKQTYFCNVSEVPALHTLPAAAYYKARNRYRAPVLLQYLNAIKGFDKIIGITTKDISTTNGKFYDWGIMGLGSCPGKSCVISTFRIRTSDKLLFNDRFVKVALHELGHTMGLPHCTFSKTCFMEAAEGSIKSVDRESRSLCSNCRRLLKY